MPDLFKLLSESSTSQLESLRSEFLKDTIRTDRSRETEKRWAGMIFAEIAVRVAKKAGIKKPEMFLPEENSNAVS